LTRDSLVFFLKKN